MLLYTVPSKSASPLRETVFVSIPLATITTLVPGVVDMVQGVFDKYRIASSAKAHVSVKLPLF